MLSELCYSCMFVLLLISVGSAQQYNAIVIGAGISGLAAARQLVSFNYNVLVLEAQNRYGGRILSNYSFDPNGIYAMDMGAVWIQGNSTNDPITGLTLQYQIQTVATDWRNQIVYNTDNQVIYNHLTKFAGSEYDYEYALFKKFKKAVSKAQQADYDYQDTTESIQDVFDYFQKNQGLSNTSRMYSDLLWRINSEIEQEYAADISWLALHYDQDLNFGGNEVLFPKGYIQVPNVLASGLNIKYNAKVLSITYKKGLVTVATTAGTFTASVAIVTLPLGVLQSGTVTFNPPLGTSSPAKADAISNMGVGFLNKVILKFPYQFWPNVTVLEHIPPAAQKGQWVEWLSYTSVNGMPILVVYNGGDFGRKVESLTDSQIISDIMAVLQGMFGTNIPQPSSYAVTRWGQNPYALGSYSYLKVGCKPSVYTALASSVSSALFFAGEHTSKQYPASVPGAYLSGVAAAKAAKTYIPKTSG